MPNPRTPQETDRSAITAAPMMRPADPLQRGIGSDVRLASVERSGVAGTAPRSDLGEGRHTKGITLDPLPLLASTTTAFALGALALYAHHRGPIARAEAELTAMPAWVQATYFAGLLPVMMVLSLNVGQGVAEVRGAAPMLRDALTPASWLTMTASLALFSVVGWWDARSRGWRFSPARTWRGTTEVLREAQPWTWALSGFVVICGVVAAASSDPRVHDVTFYVVIGATLGLNACLYLGAGKDRAKADRLAILAPILTSTAAGGGCWKLATRDGMPLQEAAQFGVGMGLVFLVLGLLVILAITACQGARAFIAQR